MTRINIIDIAALPDDLLAGFLRFASLPDASTQDVATRALRSGLAAVSEYSHTALVEMTVRHQESGKMVHSITPFAGDVTNVSYGVYQFGEIVFEPTSYVEVTYSVSPLSSELDRLTTIAYRYALAVYDGADSRTLGSILSGAL